jgi:hypothetical protein
MRAVATPWKLRCWRRRRCWSGRRFVPPGKRPSTGVAARKGRERPRVCLAEAAPRRPAGSLTPQMSVPLMCWGACQVLRKPRNKRWLVPLEMWRRNRTRIARFDHAQFPGAPARVFYRRNSWSFTRTHGLLRVTLVATEVLRLQAWGQCRRATVLPSLRSRFSGSAWARQGSVRGRSPLRGLDPPGALPIRPQLPERPRDQRRRAEETFPSSAISPVSRLGDSACHAIQWLSRGTIERPCPWPGRPRDRWASPRSGTHLHARIHRCHSRFDYGSGHQLETRIVRLYHCDER